MPGTIIVGCKMPNGVILNLDRYERVGDSANLAVRMIPGKQTVTLKGWAHKVGYQPDVTLETGGYRLNEVDEDFWNEWYARNKESSLLTDGLIFAAPANKAGGKAVEQEKLPRQFAPLTGGETPGVAKFDGKERAGAI